MKRIMYLGLLGGLLAGLTIAAAAQSESLGDAARAARKDKKIANTTHEYDNDNLPKTDKLNVVGQEGEESAANAAPDNTGANAGQDATATTGEPGETKPGDSADERKKAVDEWKTKIS